MGSKRKSAHKIYAALKNRHPEANTLVDLFCGGLAIGEIFIQNSWNVIANDKNKYVVELIREAVAGRFNDDVFTPDFITRDKFNDVIKNPSKYDDWYVGYVACIWSFGNNNKGYLFGKDKEPIKKAGHELVVNKNPELIKGIIPDKYITSILKLDDWHKRRLALSRVSKALKTRIHELEQLERLERLELTLHSDEYFNINIPKGSVVYCDPPYDGTAEYVEGGFNHKQFWQWARETSKINAVYISEYTAPKDFKVVRSWPQKSTLQGGTQLHNNQPDEKLFTYNKSVEKA